MHELSLCQSIQEVVERARDGRPVATVHLEIGQLRQVVPETLAYCWEIVTADGPLAGSALAIDHVPVVLECHDCHASTTVRQELSLTCGECGSGSVTMVSGEEFLLTFLDLVPQPQEL